MKMGFLAIALVSVVLVHSAEAQQPRQQRTRNVVIGAELISNTSDAERGTPAADGRVDLDVTARIARLTLNNYVRGRSAPQTTQMRVQSITRDNCNVITYVAFTRVGGTTLTVRDRSDLADRCRNPRVARVDTEVELRLVAEGRGDAAPVNTKYTAARLSRQGPNYILDDGETETETDTK